MQNRHTVRLEDRNEFAQETAFLVHQRLVEGHDCEVPHPRDPSYVNKLSVGIIGDDQRAGVLWAISVQDLDRDALFTDGENGFLVQDGGAHVRQFAQFLVRDDLDGAGFRDDPRVHLKETRDVGPVLVEVGANSPG